jgi:hypothetical protein
MTQVNQKRLPSQPVKGTCSKRDCRVDQKKTPTSLCGGFDDNEWRRDQPEERDGPRRSPKKCKPADVFGRNVHHVIRGNWPHHLAEPNVAGKRRRDTEEAEDGKCCLKDGCHGPNENKMSDGGRRRVSIRVEV